MTKLNNLFCTVLTDAAPTSNYRGQNEENRTMLQKVTKDDQEYAIISSESMRNAIREILQQYGLPTNRTRVYDEEQLAVRYKECPNSDLYSDDFLFGYMVADSKKYKSKLKTGAKRDSVFRMNIAVATCPYRQEATFHQSPQIVDSVWKNTENSVLFNKEVSHTAFQYPFGINLNDCKDHPEWAKALIQAISELSNVAGGHARSLYNMDPKSLVARLTPRLVPGYNSYGFMPDGSFPDLIRINKNDLPGSEFVVAGDIVRSMSEEEKARLTAEGVALFENCSKALSYLAEKGFQK